MVVISFQGGRAFALILLRRVVAPTICHWKDLDLAAMLGMPFPGGFNHLPMRRPAASDRSLEWPFAAAQSRSHCSTFHVIALAPPDPSRTATASLKPFAMVVTSTLK